MHSVHLRCVVLPSQLSPEFREFAIAEGCRASWETFAESDENMMSVDKLNEAMQFCYMVTDLIEKGC